MLGKKEIERSGIAVARKRGVVFGRHPDRRIKADYYGPKCKSLSAKANRTGIRTLQMNKLLSMGYCRVNRSCVPASMRRDLVKTA
jgi:hypothetical protein